MNEIETFRQENSSSIDLFIESLKNSHMTKQLTSRRYK